MPDFKEVIESKKYKNLFYGRIDIDFVAANLPKMLSGYFNEKTINRVISQKRYIQRYRNDTNWINMVTGEMLLYWDLKSQGNVYIGKGASIRNTVKYPQGFDGFASTKNNLLVGEVKAGKYDYAIPNLIADYKKFDDNGDDYAIANFVDFLIDEKAISVKKEKRITKKLTKKDILFHGMALYDKADLKNKTYQDYFDEKITKETFKYDSSRVNAWLLLSVDDFKSLKEQVFEELNNE